MNSIDFRSKVKDIADLLGYESECSVSCNRGSLSKDEAILFISSSDGRLHISGRYPADKSGYMGYGRKKAAIWVTAEKSACRIAQEISKRLLPQYLPALEEAVAQVKDQDDYTDTRLANVQELGHLAGVGLRSGCDRDVPRFRFGGEGNYDHEVKCQGKDTIEMKLDSLTMEQAKKVIDLLKN